MTTLRHLAFIAMVAVLPDGDALAQSPSSEPVSTTGGEERVWSFCAHAHAYTYIQPDDDNYLQPTVAVDRDRLHLEARYNYENLDTGSVWAGYNFSVGEKVAWEATAMLGGVFGDTNREIQRGFFVGLSAKRVDFTAYVFNPDRSPTVVLALGVRF